MMRPLLTSRRDVMHVCVRGGHTASLTQSPCATEDIGEGGLRCGTARRTSMGRARPLSLAHQQPAPGHTAYPHGLLPCPLRLIGDATARGLPSSGSRTLAVGHGSRLTLAVHSSAHGLLSSRFLMTLASGTRTADLATLFLCRLSFGGFLFPGEDGGFVSPVMLRHPLPLSLRVFAHVPRLSGSMLRARGFLSRGQRASL